MKKYFFWFLVGIIFFLFSFEIFSHKEVYLTRWDPEYWRQRYEKSQWAKGWEAEEKMGDAELYAYAGWRQVKGEDPTKINSEVPPFGKYLIGLSILFFGNPYIQAPIFGLLFLLTIFLWGKRILKNEILALIPVFLLVLDPLFKENLSTSMLDLPFSLFIMLAFLFLAKGRKNHWFYLPTVIFLGAVASTKLYLVGFALVAIFFGYLLFLWLIFHYKDVFWFLIFLPIFVIFYFGNYIVYFLSGHNILDFKYLHFWVRHFARVQVENYPKGEIFRILLFGKWRTWWNGGEIIRVTSWRPWWFLSFLAIFPSIFQGLFKRKLDLLVLCIWPVSLLVMFSLGAPYPRYLLPVLPPLYILLCYNLKEIYQRWRS